MFETTNKKAKLKDRADFLFSISQSRQKQEHVNNTAYMIPDILKIFDDPYRLY